MHKLQLLASADEPIGVDEAAAHRSGVENHVSGDAHQDVPIVSCVGEATHCNAEKYQTREKKERDVRQKLCIIAKDL